MSTTIAPSQSSNTEAVRQTETGNASQADLGATRRPAINTELPGPKGRAIVQADAQLVNPGYPRPSFKLVVERAQGVWAQDVDGNIFLDCNAGVAVCNRERYCRQR